MRALLALVLLAGCRLETDALDSSATRTVPGIYEGDLQFTVKARFGPFRLAQQDCDAPITVDVDPSARPLVLGTVSCDFGPYGEAIIELDGNTAPFPEVTGTLDGGPVSGDWHGGFVEDGVLHGETSGSVPWRGGVRLVYEGWFEAARTAPLSADDDDDDAPETGEPGMSL